MPLDAYPGTQKNNLLQILSQQILLQAEEEDVGQDRGFIS
jgi:hypothetical protein